MAAFFDDRSSLGNDDVEASCNRRRLSKFLFSNQISNFHFQQIVGWEKNSPDKN